MKTIVTVIAALFAALLTLPFLVILILPVGLLDAFVIRDMWLWFAVPFLGARPLTLGSAFGLNLLFLAFSRTYRNNDTDKEKNKYNGAVRLVSLYLSLIIGILLSWGVAWLTAHYWTHTV